MQVSAWCGNQGPGSIVLSVGSMVAHPYSGVRVGMTVPPGAVAIAWAPKQTPRIGTPWAWAWRKNTSSRPIHDEMSGEYTNRGRP